LQSHYEICRLKEAGSGLVAEYGVSIVGYENNKLGVTSTLDETLSNIACVEESDECPIYTDRNHATFTVYGCSDNDDLAMKGLVGASRAW
jgi:hypothetical protein